MRKFVVGNGFGNQKRKLTKNRTDIVNGNKSFVFFQNYCGFSSFTIQFAFCLIGFIFLSDFQAFAQQTYTSQFSPQMTAQFAQGQTGSGNYLKNSAAFRQEIMKMEINVVRGSRVLPITQVPRVQKGDVIKMHLLDEATGGIKPSESMWNWTFLVAFVNPNRRSTADGNDEENVRGNLRGGDKVNIGKQTGTVSEEIQFRKSGWYREYSFLVPYDSQPVFFLYPRPKYRGQILKLVNQKYEEVRKLGEKTIELANAYSRIDSFLGELQSVLYRTQSSYYGSFVTYPQAPANGTNNNSNNGYGSYNPYNPYGNTYNPYNPYNPGTGYGNTTGNNQLQRQLDPSYNYNAFFEQTIERLAASFNLSLPSCWQSFNGGYNYFGSPGGYGSSYGGGFSSGGGYSSGYSSGSYGGLYGSGSGGGNGANSFGHAVSSEFIGRAQCVAKGIRIEDFDFSVGRMLQQGGLFALTQLRDKYPHLAYYINIAAIAIEFIVKVFQKYPLKIVPTLIQTSDNTGFGGSNSGSSYGNGYSSGSYGNNYSSNYASSSSASFSPSVSPNAYSSNSVNSLNLANSTSFQPVKISVYAESQPSDTEQVTAYPVVVHRWQTEPDPEIISLNPPIPLEPCLHAGTNILKSTDISKDDSQDIFTRDFKLNVSSTNGFTKIFPLKKNIGAGGWELNLTQEDLNSFPKIQMTLEAEVTGTRGFNEIRSPKFVLPLNTGNNWQIKPESQKAFAVGGRRIVTLQNISGTCRCLQAVIYKPNFGGQFVFEANAKNLNNQLQFSPDGREVSFEVDATYFQAGTGTLEMKVYGDNQPNGSSSPINQSVNPVFNQTNGVQANGQNGQNNQNGQSNVLNIKLYPLPPEIADFRIAGGDRQAVVTGNRLEQLQWIRVNGKRMVVPNQGNKAPGNQGSAAIGAYGNQSPNPSTSPNVSNSGLPTPTIANPINNPMNNSANLLNVSTPQTVMSFSAGANERTFVFEDANTKQEGGAVSLELGLDDDRSFAYPVQFKVKPARPTLVTGNNNEIDGVVVSNSSNGIGINSNGNIQNASPGSPGNQNNVAKSKRILSSQFSALSLKDIFTIDTREISVGLQNALTDYDFKPENLSVETRIENGGANIGELPRASFEVFDWKSMRLNITLNEQIMKIIGGRRLQLRIRDRERGDSDWYTIRQTFVRMPEIKSIRCTSQMNGQCEMKGFGIEYVGQVSVDGGKSWFPSENQSLQIQQKADGQSAAMIPLLVSKKFLLIKFRDFPKMDGIYPSNFVFLNSARISKALSSAIEPGQDLIQSPGLSNNLSSPGATVVQNPPINSSKPKLDKKPRKVQP